MDVRLRHKCEQMLQKRRLTYSCLPIATDNRNPAGDTAATDVTASSSIQEIAMRLRSFAPLLLAAALTTHALPAISRPLLPTPPSAIELGLTP